MPGRHGSGSLGGGHRSGGGYRGGGYRGGGYRGGGYRGGWGGGPRFRWFGPGWGWRPRFFWGRPMFFGGPGFGCGGIGLGIGLFVLIALIFSSGFFRGLNRYTNPGVNYNNSGGGLYNQPSAVQTQTAIDLAELHGALDTRIPDWQNSIARNEEKHVSADDAGMGDDNNIKDVVYGKCGNAFYVFVVDKDVPENAGSATASGYAYTTATSPATCHPSEYTVTDTENDGGGWSFVYLR